MAKYIHFAVEHYDKSSGGPIPSMYYVQAERRPTIREVVKALGIEYSTKSGDRIVIEEIDAPKLKLTIKE